MTRLRVDKVIELPEKLKYLEVDFENFTKEDALLFSNMMPRTLEKIYLHESSEDAYFVSPPFSIEIHINTFHKNVILNDYERLEISTLTCEFNDFKRPKFLAIYYVGKFLTQKLPNSIEHLVLNNVTKLSPGIIPNSVKKLKLNVWSNLDLKDVIPNSVTRLMLWCGGRVNIENCIPNSVTHLDLVCDSKFKVPQSVTHFKYHNVDLLETLEMSSVIYLTLIPYSNSTKTFINIPACVIHLKIHGMNFSFKLKLNNVKFLKLRKGYYEYIKDCISEEVKVSFIK